MIAEKRNLFFSFHRETTDRIEKSNKQITDTVDNKQAQLLTYRTPRSAGYYQAHWQTHA